MCHLIYITFKRQQYRNWSAEFADVPSVTQACPVRYPYKLPFNDYRWQLSLYDNHFLQDEYLANLLQKYSFAANMAIFRELSLCCWSAGKSCPRSVPSVTSTSGATEFLVFNPEWIFNYECQLVHETCPINFTDACCWHKWLCNGRFEAKNCVKMSRPLRRNDSRQTMILQR